MSLASSPASAPFVSSMAGPEPSWTIFARGAGRPCCRRAASGCGPGTPPWQRRPACRCGARRSTRSVRWSAPCPRPWSESRWARGAVACGAGGGDLPLRAGRDVLAPAPAGDRREGSGGDGHQAGGTGGTASGHDPSPPRGVKRRGPRRRPSLVPVGRLCCVPASRRMAFGYALCVAFCPRWVTAAPRRPGSGRAGGPPRPGVTRGRRSGGDPPAAPVLDRGAYRARWAARAGARTAAGRGGRGGADLEDRPRRVPRHRALSSQTPCAHRQGGVA